MKKYFIVFLSFIFIILAKPALAYAYDYNINVSIDYNTNYISISAPNCGTGWASFLFESPEKFVDCIDNKYCKNEFSFKYTTAHPAYGLYTCRIRLPIMKDPYQFTFFYNPPYLKTLNKPLLNISANSYSSFFHGIFILKASVSRNTDIHVFGKMICALYDGDKLQICDVSDVYVGYDNPTEITTGVYYKNYDLNKVYTIKVFAWAPDLNSITPISNIITKDVKPTI